MRQAQETVSALENQILKIEKVIYKLKVKDVKNDKSVGPFDKTKYNF